MRWTLSLRQIPAYPDQPQDIHARAFTARGEIFSTVWQATTQRSLGCFLEQLGKSSPLLEAPEHEQDSAGVE